SVSPDTISELSRVNEQELFAALLTSAFDQQEPKLGELFRTAFKERFERIREKYPEDGVFRASRRALKHLIKSKVLTRAEARTLRRLALGKAQLDSDRTRLSTAREGEEKNDTPLRAARTALA